MIRRILITGGCGFIGRNLLDYWEGQGYALRILDNLATGSPEGLPRGVELQMGDIRDPEAVERACQGVDAVVHLAAQTRVEVSMSAPELDFQINVVGLQILLETCRRQGISRFIFASSNAAVGPQEPPVNEEKRPRPISPYGAHKLCGEALCATYHRAYGMETVSLRFANVYGPYSGHKSSVVARMIQAWVGRQPILIYGDGTQSRDFIHAWDVCQAIDRALTAPVGGAVFQIGTGVETRILDLVHLLREAGRELGLPAPTIQYAPPRPGDIPRNVTDPTQARLLLGFEPQMSLGPSLRCLLAQAVEFQTPLGVVS